MSGRGQRKAWGVGEGAGATVTGVVTGVGPGALSDPPQPAAATAMEAMSQGPAKKRFFMAPMITHRCR